MLKYLKKSLFVFLICLVYLVLAFLVPKNTSAKTTLDEATLDIFAENNIMFYDPVENTDCFPNASASLTAGNTYEEKIWNYFVNLGVSGVSDNPAVIAGIMGNMKQESGYDPFVGNGQGYYGLIQGDTFADYKTFEPVYDAVTQAVGNSYWFIGAGKPDSHPSEPTQKAIQIELDAVFKGTVENEYYGAFQIFVNHLDVVSNKTPSSYAELFQVEVERGVCNNNKPEKECHSYSQPITDQGVAQRAREKYGSDWPSNGYDYQGMHERMAKAEDIYATYTSSASSSTSSSTPSSTSEDCFHSASEPFVRYDQTDEKYKNVTYGKGENASSAAESGCGPFSFAMLATALGVQNIDPAEVTKVAGDLGMHVSGGSDHNITEKLVNHYNMTYQKIEPGVTSGTYGNTLSEDDINKVIEAINSKLKEGWMIHTSGIAPIDQKSTWGNPFTPGGHYIGIRGLTSDGKWLLADSNGPNGPNKIKEGTVGNINYKYTRQGDKNSTKEWDPREVVLAGLNITNLRAIRASNATPCGNYTSGGPCDGGSVSGGLSDSDAEKLAKHYRDNANTLASQGYYLGGAGPWNCVALSFYFLQKITTLGVGTEISSKLPNGLTGNGWRVATQIHEYFHLPMGTTAKPYAIFSTADPEGAKRGINTCDQDSYGHAGESCGHTGLIVAVNGDDITYIDARYRHIGYAGVVHAKLSDFKNDYAPNGLFVYLDDILDRSAIQSLLSGEN